MFVSLLTFLHCFSSFLIQFLQGLRKVILFLNQSFSWRAYTESSVSLWSSFEDTKLFFKVFLNVKRIKVNKFKKAVALNWRTENNYIYCKMKYCLDWPSKWSCHKLKEIFYPSGFNPKSQFNEIVLRNKKKKKGTVEVAFWVNIATVLLK